MVRTNEGGSVLSFAIVGIILAILLVGGVSLVRQHFISSQKTTPMSQKVAQPDKKQTTPAPATSDSNQTPANEGATSPDSSTSAPAPAATRPATTPATTDLPHTGPMQTLATTLAIGLLTASSIAYVRSRRYQLPSASI